MITTGSCNIHQFQSALFHYNAQTPIELSQPCTPHGPSNLLHELSTFCMWDYLLSLSIFPPSHLISASKALDHNSQTPLAICLSQSCPPRVASWLISLTPTSCMSLPDVNGWMPVHHACRCTEGTVVETVVSASKHCAGVRVKDAGRGYVTCLDLIAMNARRTHRALVEVMNADSTAVREGMVCDVKWCRGVLLHGYLNALRLGRGGNSIWRGVNRVGWEDRGRGKPSRAGRIIVEFMGIEGVECGRGGMGEVGVDGVKVATCLVCRDGMEVDVGWGGERLLRKRDEEFGEVYRNGRHVGGWKRKREEEDGDWEEEDGGGGEEWMMSRQQGMF